MDGVCVFVGSYLESNSKYCHFSIKVSIRDWLKGYTAFVDHCNKAIRGKQYMRGKKNHRFS